MRKDRERRGQFLINEFLCSSTYFDCLRHGNAKVFRLLNEAPRRHLVRFGRVNEIETKKVFLLARTYMKAVAVVRRVGDEPAILQYNPLSGSIARAKADRTGAKDTKSNERAYADSREDRRDA